MRNFSSHCRVPADRFTRLLLAHGLSQLGVGFHLAAFPLLISALTSDPMVVAISALASTVPGIVLALPVGAWVDRAHRGRLMVGSDLVCAGVLLSVTVLIATGQIQLWMLLVSGGLVGCAELVFGVSTYALLPSIVPGSDLTRANSLLSVAGQTGAGIVGPALGGLSYGAARLLPFAVNTVTYLASAATITSFVRRADTRAAPVAGDRSGHNHRPELLAGVRYLRANRPIRALITLSASAGFFGWMPEATFVLFTRDRLGLGATGFGVLLGVTTCGAVIGGLLTGRVVGRLGTRRTLYLAYSMYGVLLVPVGLLGDPVIVGVFFFVQGLPMIACEATVRSLQQRVVPNDLLGRVGAINRFAHNTVTPLGLAVGGLLAGWLGLSAVWIIAGCGYLAAFVANLPAIRTLDGPEPADR